MAAPSGGGLFGPQTMIFIGLVFFAFYFLILRPQRAEQRKREDTLNQLGRGDKVVTAGGIHGVITNTSSKDTVEVEVAKNVRLTLNRSSISVLDNAARAAEKAAAKAEAESNGAAKKEKEKAVAK
jgi:preprotein translocase subunit YajC